MRLLLCKVRADQPQIMECNIGIQFLFPSAGIQQITGYQHHVPDHNHMHYERVDVMVIPDTSYDSSQNW